MSTTLKRADVGSQTEPDNRRRRDARQEMFIGEDPQGERLVFRQLESSDADDLNRALGELSARSRRMRFFAEPQAFSERQLRYLTQLDRTNHDAWIAIAGTRADPHGVGIARWVRLTDKPSSAEIAVTVLDDWQRRRIGRTLVWLCARGAKAHGISSFRLSVLGTNSPMLSLLRRFTTTSSSWQSGVLETEADLPDKEFEPSHAPIPLTPVDVFLQARGGE